MLFYGQQESLGLGYGINILGYIKCGLKITGPQNLCSKHFLLHLFRDTSSL